MPLPNPGMSFTPFDVLPASDLNDMVENIEGLAAGTGLDDGAITPEQIKNGAGTTWAMATWAISWTNVSGGTTNYSKFLRLGNFIFFRVQYTLAGAGVAGAISFSAPVAFHADYGVDTPIPGKGGFLDAGNNIYSGELSVGPTNTIKIRPINSAGTNAAFGADASSTNPFTFGASDIIYASGWYEATN